MFVMNLILFLLLIKHAIADLGLQGYIQGPSKQYYLSRKLVIHSLHHGIGTFLVLLYFVNVELAFVLGILDMILHWQIDFCKTRFVIAFNLNNTQRNFWWVQAVDQILHYSTYVIIVALIFWA
jgi:hypothetical protein